MGWLYWAHSGNTRNNNYNSAWTKKTISAMYTSVICNENSYARSSEYLVTDVDPGFLVGGGGISRTTTFPLGAPPEWLGLGLGYRVRIVTEDRTPVIDDISGNLPLCYRCHFAQFLHMLTNWLILLQFLCQLLRADVVWCIGFQEVTNFVSQI